MRAILALALTLSCLGCMSTQIELDSKWDRSTKPAYEDYMDSFLFGLVGANEISLSRICIDQKTYGLRRYLGATDGILSVITLGIYAPYTVQVWCGD